MGFYFKATGPWLRALLAGASITCTLLAGCSGPRQSYLEHASVRSDATGSALDNVDRVEATDGVDPAVLDALKGALSAAIKSGRTRVVAGPPTAAFSRVDDFRATVEADSVLFEWTYRNPGDYNLDGEANPGDLAALGRWLNVTSASPDWPEARAADGDRNGAVTVADLAPLGANLFSQVQFYILRYSANPQSTTGWTTLAELSLRDDGIREPGRIVFRADFSIGALPTDFVYFQVVPKALEELGVPSNTIALEDAPPLITAVGPLGGRSAETVEFNASVLGDEPLQFLWDFGGAATPNTSNDRNPRVTLGGPGSYAASLNVGNAVGEHTFSFLIQVSSNQDPQAQLSATPNAGPAPLVVTLDASGSTDPDGTIVRYQWDTTGDGQLNLDTGAVPTASTTLTSPGTYTLRVRVTDNHGATAETSVLANVASLPSAVITASTTQVVAPDWVTLDAKGSSSQNGEIVKYEWDWDGNGFWNATTTDPYLRQQFDARPGTYNATVRVTDSQGASNTASVAVHVAGVSVPNITNPEPFVDHGKPGDTPAQKWLKNVYAALPEWRTAKGPYQAAYYAVWSDQLFSLLNATRIANGLQPVTRVIHLDLVAQAHCRDEAVRNYFSHTSPEGLNHETRPKAVNPLTSNWGEVLAIGQDSPAECMDKWMLSSSHRNIILSPLLRYAGVGIYYKPNFTQGLEHHWGIQFADFATDPTTHDWIEPQDVVK